MPKPFYGSRLAGNGTGLIVFTTWQPVENVGPDLPWAQACVKILIKCKSSYMSNHSFFLNLNYLFSVIEHDFHRIQVKIRRFKKYFLE